MYIYICVCINVQKPDGVQIISEVKKPLQNPTPILCTAYRVEKPLTPEPETLKPLPQVLLLAAIKQQCPKPEFSIQNRSLD